MIKNIDCFIDLKKLEYKTNFEKNKLKKEKKQKRFISIYNQNINDYNYFTKIDKVYELENLHKKINWFKYYLELYIVEYLEKLNNIKNNKINLK